MLNRIPLPAAVMASTLAFAALLLFYWVVVVAVSGWGFAQSQFVSTWYFVISLALGFGLQVGLYTYLKQSLAHRHASGATVAVSGTTSGVAMVACCAHYLANVAPLLGLAGVISFLGQYQRQLFWVGILFNFVGLVYLSYQIFQFKKHQQMMV